MQSSLRHAAMLFAFLFLSALPCGPAAAQDEDAAALAKYRLTDEGLADFLQATRNLYAAVKADPGLRTRMDAGSKDDATIEDTAALYDSEPAVRRAIESADMTSTEYVTFMYSMAQAAMGAWTVQQYGEAKLPQGTPPENVDFYLANADKINAVAEEMEAFEEGQN